MIMKNFKFFAFIMALGIALTAVSCGKDDDGYDPKKDHGYDFITGGGLDNGGGSSSSNLTQPVHKKEMTTTTTTDVTFKCIFENGGDECTNMRCNVYWASYSKKPSSKPTASELRKCESMREYSTSSKRETTFTKSHSGLSGGTYIYYYYECRNSKYTTKTDVMWNIVKR